MYQNLEITDTFQIISKENIKQYQKQNEIEGHIFLSRDILSDLLHHGKIPKKYPPQVQIDLTNNCNIKCSYCSFLSSIKKAGNSDLPIDDLYRFLDQFASHGGISVFLTGGGEPGMYSYVKDLLKYFASSRLILTLNTNGYFIEQIWKIATTQRTMIQQVWSSQKPAIISISYHNISSLYYVRILRELVDTLSLAIRIRVSCLIESDTRVNDLKRMIMEIQEAGADIVSPKPMHVGTLCIGDEGQRGQRVFISNQKVQDFLYNLNPDEYSIEVLPMRMDRLSDSFIQKKRADYDRLVCLASLTRMIINAYQELSICCTSKLPGIGMGDKYFPCGYAFNSSIFGYYMDILVGMLNFDNFYCIYGCGYLKLNNSWDMNDNESKFLMAIKKLKDDLKRDKKLSKLEIIIQLAKIFDFSTADKNEIMDKLFIEALHFLCKRPVGDLPELKVQKILSQIPDNVLNYSECKILQERIKKLSEKCVLNYKLTIDRGY